MTKTMAEVLRETMRDHRVLWETCLDEDSDLCREVRKPGPAPRTTHQPLPREGEQ